MKNSLFEKLQKHRKICAVIILTLCIIGFIANGYQKGSNTSLTQEHWMPARATVISTPEEWAKLISSKDGDTFESSGFGMYKRVFANSNHYVFFKGITTEYATEINGALVQASYFGGYPSQYTKVKSFSHTGNGVVQFQLSRNWSYILSEAILHGFFTAFLIMIFPFFVTLIWTLIADIRRRAKPKHNAV